MERIDTPLAGVFLVRPTLFTDSRGYFFESYHQEKFARLGAAGPFVQHNQSKSAKRTLRGLHYQLGFPQAKLCRVSEGKVFDVAVDIRKGSPNFGKWTGVELTSENHEMIYIPKGFAHGFVVLSDFAIFQYLCDEYYHPEDEQGIAWNDPDIGIDWRVDDPILSAKDRGHLPLMKMESHRLPSYP